MKKIVCIIKGGSIQEVYSSEEMEVEIIDLDNDENITDQELKEKIKDLKSIY